MYFRNRVGQDGVGKIFAYSVHLHGVDVAKKSKFVLSDTTVQENSTKATLYSPEQTVGSGNLR